MEPRSSAHVWIANALFLNDADAAGLAEMRLGAAGESKARSSC